MMLLCLSVLPWRHGIDHDVIFLPYICLRRLLILLCGSRCPVVQTHVSSHFFSKSRSSAMAELDNTLTCVVTKHLGHCNIPPHLYSRKPPYRYFDTYGLSAHYSTAMVDSKRDFWLFWYSVQQNPFVTPSSSVSLIAACRSFRPCTRKSQQASFTLMTLGSLFKNNYK